MLPITKADYVNETIKGQYLNVVLSFFKLVATLILSLQKCFFFILKYQILNQLTLFNRYAERPPGGTLSLPFVCYLSILLKDQLMHIT